MLQPEGTKVIIKPDVVNEMTDSGRLFLPDTVRYKEQIAVTRGTIEAIGPLADIVFESGEAKAGDRVVFARYGGYILKWDSEDYRVIHDKDIICLILGDENDGK